MEVASFAWSLASLSIGAGPGRTAIAMKSLTSSAVAISSEEGDFDAAALLCKLADAPVVRQEEWNGHSLCLLANALYPVRMGLSPALWAEIETRWLRHMDFLASALQVENSPVDSDSYVQGLQASGCFHAGPYYTHFLLAELGVPEAPWDFTSDARGRVLASRAALPVEVSAAPWSTDVAMGETVTGIVCMLGFSIDVVGKRVADQQLFVSEARPVHVEQEAPLDSFLVAAPLAHDRSGHAEFLALSRVLSAVHSGGLDLRSEPIRSCVTGHVFLYVTHHPCLSCVGAISQFSALLPNVSLRVSYDWRPAVPRGG